MFFVLLGDLATPSSWIFKVQGFEKFQLTVLLYGLPLLYAVCFHIKNN